MSSTELGDDADIQTFKRWTVTALKDFLRKRGLTVTGDKETLVARSFSAWENKRAILPSAEEKRQERLRSYKDLLVVDDVCLPDPIKELKTGWFDEKDGKVKWPPTMIQDISVYLAQHETDIKKASLTKRLLCDYKEQKAYSYFDSNFLGDIFYHGISDSSDLCFLKAECRPSQRMNDPRHNVWVCLEKKSGEIKRAFCSCVAGLGQTCNHMAALLLKVDFCWQYGHIQPAVTSQACGWTNPKRTGPVMPARICEMEIKKPRAERKSITTRRLNPTPKRTFKGHDASKGETFEEFLEHLAEVHPESVTLAERKENLNETQVVPTTGSNVSLLPESIVHLATHATSIDNFLQEMWQPMSAEDISTVEFKTRGQADNPCWLTRREGRITTTAFHDVYTRMQTVEKNPDTDCSNLVNRVLGVTKPPQDLVQFKYGRRMESFAFEKFKMIMKDNGHDSLIVAQCGLFVDKNLKFVGSSPDGLVSCSCHGDGLLEIKCPIRASNKAPVVEDLEYMEYDEAGTPVLRHAHRYYDQVQGQMGVTGRDYCYFVVYSHHGYLVDKVFFNAERWDSLLQSIILFFRRYLAPRLCKS